VAVSPGGSAVFVTGSVFPRRAAAKFGTVAYDPATGARLWAARYGTAAGPSEALAIAVSPDGSAVFVTGFSTSATPNQHDDYATVAYSAATGARLWTARYHGPGFANIARSVAVSPDGSAVYVTGESADSFPGQPTQYATVAYDAATGHTLWSARYGPIGQYSNAHSVTVSPDGATVYVTGYSPPAGNPIPQFATVAYGAATGARLWASRYPPPPGGGIQPDTSRATTVMVSPDGTKVYVAGTRAAGYAAVAYNAATGARLWAARYRARTGGGLVAASAAMSPDGAEVVVTGTSFKRTPGPVYATVAFDAATGTRLWAVFDGTPGQSSEATAVTVSPDSAAVYITGVGGPGFDTVAHNAITGARLWTARYTGPFGSGPTPAESVAVSPDGATVYVTGTALADSNATTSVYATVAYRA
jgi:DNA-binding beta-propeller fold protein YncE